MTREFHLHVVPSDRDHDPFDPAAAVTVPLGGGLAATVHDGDHTVSVGELATLSTTVPLLWQAAATSMLATLGELTAAHGTALRHRTVSPGVREIAVIGAPFPAAGLVAHPLLALPTDRILATSRPAALFIGADQRLFVTDGNPPGAPCTGPVDISAGHCRTLESVP